MTPEQLTAEKVRLERMIKLREGNLGFGDNVRAIRAALADIERQLEAPE